MLEEGSLHETCQKKYNCLLQQIVSKELEFHQKEMKIREEFIEAMKSKREADEQGFQEKQAILQSYYDKKVRNSHCHVWV